MTLPESGESRNCFFTIKIRLDWIRASLARTPIVHVCVCVTSAEDCDSKREFDQDCSELLISPFNFEQLVQDVDFEEFVGSAFPDDTPLEKHVLVI